MQFLSWRRDGRTTWNSRKQVVEKVGLGFELPPENPVVGPMDQKPKLEQLKKSL